MDQRIINLYDEYTHAPLSRQEFIKRLVLITGSIAAATSVLPMLESDYSASSIATGSEELYIETITYPGADGVNMQAYLARPAQKEKFPAVIVIHENRGLNPHIEDVTRRAARAGFLAIAPNALSPLGGTPADEDEARQLFTKLDQSKSNENFRKVFEYLPSRTDYSGKAGCVGFCWGGAMANHLAVTVPELEAAVAFYGRQPATEDVSKIKAAVQLHYGEMDTRVNEGIPAYEEALKKNDIDYELYVYEGAQHAFHNDTSASRYNEKSATLAWQRTIDFFNRHLKHM